MMYELLDPMEKLSTRYVRAIVFNLQLAKIFLLYPQGDRETNGKYTFAAYETGVYTYCFNNQMSSVTPKVLMFTMEISDAPSGTPGKSHDM